MGRFEKFYKVYKNPLPGHHYGDMVVILESLLGKIMPGRINRAKAQKFLWFLSRAVLFAGLWFLFAYVSVRLSLKYDDVGSPFWYAAVILMSPLVFMAWVATDIYYSRKGTTPKELSVIAIKSAALHAMFSPAWGWVVLTIDIYYTKILKLFSI